MSKQAATDRMMQVVRSARAEAQSAEREYDSAASDIQYKASYSINLFGGDATSRVADIARDARRACDNLYAAYQSLVRIVDEQCRPLLDEDPALSAVKEVRDLIKWLNDESEIENNFTASFNSRDLGGVASARYVPSMDNKMIQRYWESKYSMWPGRAEQEAREREEAAQRRRVQEEARRRAQEEERKQQEAAMAEYERLHREWEAQKRSIEDQRRAAVQQAAAAEKEKQLEAAGRAYKDKKAGLMAEMADCKAKKNAAETILPTLGFFAFGEKSANKKTIQAMTIRIAQLEAELTAHESWYMNEKRSIENRSQALRAKLSREMERKYPIPAEPRKPRASLTSVSGNMTAVQLANRAVQQAILDWMEPGRLYTVPEIQEGCPECADLTNQRVSALIRQLLPEHLERIEDKRKAYFRLVE